MDVPSVAPSAPAAAPDSWILPLDILRRFDFPALFGNGRPVDLELGAGDGSFLAQWAAASPDCNFVGVERLLGRLRKLDRKARRAGLSNLRCVRLEGAYVLEWMVPPGSLSGLHVYFPDPWPKRRHWKRRLIQRRFAELAAVALRSGGHVFLRTDHEGYFEAMQEAFAGVAEFHAVPTPERLLAVRTDFECDFHARGIPTRHVAYARR